MGSGSVTAGRERKGCKSDVQGDATSFSDTDLGGKAEKRKENVLKRKTKHTRCG